MVINEATFTKQVYFPEYAYYLYDYDVADIGGTTLLPPSPPSTAEAETSDIRSFFPETWLWSLALLPSVFASCALFEWLVMFYWLVASFLGGRKEVTMLRKVVLVHQHLIACLLIGNSKTRMSFPMETSHANENGES